MENLREINEDYRKGWVNLESGTSSILPVLTTVLTLTLVLGAMQERAQERRQSEQNSKRPNILLIVADDLL